VNEGQVMLLAQGFATLYGLVIGSFWNVAIARLPEDRSLWPRSACPQCGAAITAADNVPVLSWLWLRGKCRSCATPISPKYPLVELLGGLLGLLLFRALVPSFSQLDLANLSAWVVQFTFLTLVVIGAFVDLRHRILPDEVTIYAMPFGILGAAWLEYVGYDGWLSVGWRQAVIAALVWPLLFWLVALFGRLWADFDVLGFGDVKLMAMFGAFLGPVGTFVAVMWGSILGAAIGIVALVIMRRRAALPFGPPLAIGAIAVVFYGQNFAELMFPMLLR
jgi:leader peptidase (prepilin peptidase) / N-methyltransferase